MASFNELKKLMFEFPNNKIEKKDWGFKYNSFKGLYVNSDLCLAKKDGYCSLHYHRYKSNYFHVLFGKLLIIYHTKDNHNIRENEIIIGEDCETRVFTVFPNVRHRFVALTDCLFMEFDSTRPNTSDIIRIKPGGNNYETDQIS